MKKIFVFLFLFVVISFANAQDSANSILTKSHNQNRTKSEKPEWLQNRIGLYGSFISGYGLSYQYQFENGFSLRTQFFVYGSIGSDELYDENELKIVYGADLQYNIKKTEDTRLYAIVGSYFDYHESEDDYYDIEPSNDIDYDIERYISVGVGIGMEIKVTLNISFVIEGGYYGRFGTNSYSNYNGQEGNYVKRNPKEFSFAIGGGVFYAF